MVRLFVLCAATAATIALYLTSGAAVADTAGLARDVMAPQTPRPPGSVVGVRMTDARPGEVVVFGQAFRPGDIPRGATAIARGPGGTWETQVDAKARHPDGSLRHGAISLKVPARAGADAAVALYAAPVQPRRARRIRPPQIVVALSGRVAATRSLIMTDAWLSGPLTHEIRLTADMGNGLTAVADYRETADGRKRLAFDLTNDALFDAAERRYSLTVTINGRPVITARDIPHYPHSAWRRVVELGAPSAAHVVHDGPYLIAAGAVPPYDPELRLEPFFWNKLAQEHARSDHEPLKPGMIEPAMPTTGGRPDIGPIPAWAVAWLRLQTPEARQMMLDQAEAAAAVPWRFRDPETGLAPTLDDHPRAWLDYRARPGRNGHGPIRTNVGGWKLDNAHQPDLSSVPYLITADRRYLDDMHTQLAYTLLNYNPDHRGGAAGNLSRDQTRAQAWANRLHGAAAWATPDAHPLKPYLIRKLQERLRWYVSHYRSDPDYGGAPSDETFGWILGRANGADWSFWQQDYFMITLGRAAQQGAPGAAQVYGAVTRRFLLGRFLTPEFNPLWGATYKTLYRDASKRPLTRWRDVAARNLAAGKFDARPAQINRHDAAWGYAAAAQAGFAMATTAFRDPAAAEVYVWLASETQAMTRGNGSFARHPEWSLVPMFPDGSTLALNRRYIGGGGSDSWRGGVDTALYAGLGGDDRITGGHGNEILSGGPGADRIHGGGGINFLAGGDGDDRITLSGAADYVRGGGGADRFVISPGARGWIIDFGAQDRLQAPPGAQTSSAPGGAIVTGAGARVVLMGVSPEIVRARLSAR